MDRQAVEATRLHYDLHANRMTSQESLRARQQGLALPLKKFHNQVKRLLINRFASNADRLADFACGRGGDIHKWFDAGIKYVLGCDLSPGEIEEAERRYVEAVHQQQRQRKPTNLHCEFFQTDELGLATIFPRGELFDAVTCMFAAHYFFVSEPAFRTFLSNVSGALRVGGHFFGTLPDGKRVLRLLNQQEVMESPMLRLEKCWKGNYGCFGTAYKCAIADTVTDGEDGGSFEYLVFFNVFEAIARDYGLYPVLDYNSPEMEEHFEIADVQGHAAFKHFCPSFLGSHPSLEQASALNVAFVFEKREEPQRPLISQSPASTSAPPAKGPEIAGQAEKGSRPNRRRPLEDGAADSEPDAKRRREDGADAEAGGGTGEEG